MNTHTLCFCPLIRKLQAFEILKWAQESQWRKQRTSNFTREIQLIFSLQWKYIFLYFHGCEIQLFLKYALYLIYIFLYFITLYIINSFIRYAVSSIFSHINCIVTHWPDKRWLPHDMCLYQVIMTLHFLNNVINGIESTRKSYVIIVSLNSESTCKVIGIKYNVCAFENAC